MPDLSMWIRTARKHRLYTATGLILRTEAVIGLAGEAAGGEEDEGTYGTLLCLFFTVDGSRDGEGQSDK